MSVKKMSIKLNVGRIDVNKLFLGINIFDTIKKIIGKSVYGII